MDVKPFIPDSGFGIAYAVALFITALIVSNGKTERARALLAVQVANWLAVRGVVSGVLDFDYVSIAVPAFTSVVFAVAWRGAWGFACAAATVCILIIEHLALIGVTFNAASAMEDGLGFLTMAFIAFASHRDGGSLALHSHLCRFRPSNILHALSGWGKTKPLA